MTPQGQSGINNPTRGVGGWVGGCGASMVSGSLTRKYDKKDSEEKVIYHQGGDLSSRWSFITVVVSGWSLTGDATVSNCFLVLPQPAV